MLPTDLQTYTLVLANGQKIQGRGPQINFTEAVPGGIAKGAEGNLGVHRGNARDYTVDGLTIWVQNSTSAGDLEKWLDGGITSISYNLGDPTFGGSRITYSDLYVPNVKVSSNNQDGTHMITIGTISATRKSVT